MTTALPSCCACLNMGTGQEQHLGPTSDIHTHTSAVHIYIHTVFSLYLWCCMSCGVFVHNKHFNVLKQTNNHWKKNIFFFFQGSFSWLLHQYITIYLLSYYRGILYWYHMLKWRAETLDESGEFYRESTDACRSNSFVNEPLKLILEIRHSVSSGSNCEYIRG